MIYPEIEHETISIYFFIIIPKHPFFINFLLYFFEKIKPGSYFPDFIDYFTSNTMDLTFVIASILYLIPCTPAPEPFTPRNGKLSGPRCVLLLI